ncbi:hypothetical protein C8J57DRAFT_1245762 [Mycena rebaudengoi]|nr:hypothetical protein C8J57DRAFT_1245762 [Mycena rebaudengoi]
MRDDAETGIQQADLRWIWMTHMEQIQDKRGRPGAEETGLVEKMVKLRIYADITRLDVSAHPKTALFSAKRFSLGFKTSSPRNAGGGRMHRGRKRRGRKQLRIAAVFAVYTGKFKVSKRRIRRVGGRVRDIGVESAAAWAHVTMGGFARDGMGGAGAAGGDGRRDGGTELILIAWFNVTNAATPAVATWLNKDSGFQRPAKLDKGNPRRLSGLYKMYTEHKHSLYPAVGLLGGVYESTQSYFAGYRVIMGTKNATGQQGRGFTAENDRKSPDSHRRNRSARTSPKCPEQCFRRIKKP